MFVDRQLHCSVMCDQHTFSVLTEGFEILGRYALLPEGISAETPSTEMVKSCETVLQCSPQLRTYAKAQSLTIPSKWSSVAAIRWILSAKFCS